MTTPGSNPPPGGETPWWANPEGGHPPAWWADPNPAPPHTPGPQGPIHAPFSPGSDPAYARTYAPRPLANAKGAVASLVIGISSLVLGVCGCGIILGPIAIYQGSQARFRIRASNGRLGGNGLALAGMLLGWLAVLWFAVSVVLILTGQVHVYRPASVAP